MPDFSNRILLATDLSNILYMSVFSSKAKWKKDFPEESSFMENKWRTDQENLPNLLNYQNYRRILSSNLQEKIENITRIARKWHQVEIDSANGLDMFLVEDDRLSGNFRKRLYPEYKQHRKAVLREFDVLKAMDYARNVVLKDLGIESSLGYKIVKVKDCECDDVIYVLMTRYPGYMCKIVISSDRDYSQIEGINQYNPLGSRIVPNVGEKKESGGYVEVDRKDFLLWKIIRGDTSDNIKGVFPGYGEKKSYKLVKDRDLLKKMLKEDNSAALRFKLNRNLIDFRMIPNEIKDRIGKVLDEKMGEIDFSERDKFSDNCMVLT